MGKDGGIGMVKAQISIEALVLFAILSIMFIIWTNAYANIYYDFSQKKERLVIEDYGHAIQTELFTAADSFLGYNRQFELQDRHNGISIQTLIIAKNTTLIIAGKSYNTSFTIPNTGGQLTFGINNISNNRFGVCCNC